VGLHILSLPCPFPHSRIHSILYERLSSAALPSELPGDRHPIPPNRSGPGAPDLHTSSRKHPGPYPHHDVRDNHPRMERSISDYAVPHDRPRMSSNHGPRPLGPMSSSVAPSPYLPSRHSPPRQHSSDAYDSARHLQHMPPLPPVPQIEASRSHGNSRSHVSPMMRHPSSHHRARSPSSHSLPLRASGPVHYQGHAEAPHYPDASQHVMHSPPMLERERLRNDPHEYPSFRGDIPGNGRHSGYPTHHPPTMHPSEPHSSSRVHRHQRRGPGTYINREEHYDIDRERDWVREREVRDHERSRDFRRGRDVSGSDVLSPHPMHRTPHPVDRGDYPEHHMSSRTREDQLYYREPHSASGKYSLHSRSGSPGESSVIGASEGPSRPDSHPHYFEPDRLRSFKLRPVVQPHEDVDFSNDDSRLSRDGGGGGGNLGYSLPEPSRSSSESRKRNRNDMDIDHDSDEAPEGPRHPDGRLSEDRSSKRYHREHRRSLDTPKEDGRISMAP